MKRVLSLVLTLGMLLSCMVTGFALESSSADYINLQGDWHFKLYRKYSNMFQHLAYGACKVTWEDTDVAAVPNGDTYSTWETVLTPSPDYSTGGLLQMFRDDATTDKRNELQSGDLFPKWSEAWMCKTVDIPEGFLQEKNVTLLLGIIDDTDVVYINGSPVAASGFVTAGKTPSLEVPAIGGFAQSGDFRFEKSYWEVSREYEVPASYFHEGENEIAIRVYNNNSFGGFYDRTLALCATKSAVRELKGLPTESLASPEQVADAVAAQVAALQAKDIDAYAATLYDGYVNDGVNKEMELESWKELFETYETITIADTDTGYYYGSNNVSHYSANRVATGTTPKGTTTIISDKEWLQSYISVGGTALERGNWSRCYSVDYRSELMNNTLQYSIYLPKSYYTNADRSYPVVYLLHGINSTGKSFVDVDRIEGKMDSWIDSGKVVETIVIMPNSGKNSFYTDTELPQNGVGSDTAGPWATHITSEIRGKIEENYRTLNSPAFRALTGISMGGGGAFKLGGENPDLYTSVASHMGAVNSSTIELLKTLTDEQLAVYDFYLDCGNQDAMVSPANTQAVGEYLQSRNANVSWSLRDGAHNSAFYMTSMPTSMEMHSKHFIESGLYDIWGIEPVEKEIDKPNEANSPQTLETISNVAVVLASGDGKLPSGVTMTDDGKVALIKIKLYSDNADFSLETMKLLALNKQVGFNVTIDNGKANIIFTGGFEPYFEAGRFSYPLFFADSARNNTKMLERAGNRAAQTFMVGGNMSFPTDVTVSVKTNPDKISSGYLYHYNADTGVYTQIKNATFSNGVITFTGRLLGEFLVSDTPL